MQGKENILCCYQDRSMQSKWPSYRLDVVSVPMSYDLYCRISSNRNRLSPLTIFRGRGLEIKVIIHLAM